MYVPQNVNLLLAFLWLVSVSCQQDQLSSVSISDCQAGFPLQYINGSIVYVPRTLSVGAHLQVAIKVLSHQQYSKV